MQLRSVWWALIGTLASCVWGSPAFQIDVTQKGFTQFVEYDVAVPPLSEFTFCLRLRTVDLARHQPIFTYLVNGNEPLISLWLEAGGGNLHTRLGGAAEMVEQVTPVDWSIGVWRQLCLSWQSDAGAWALYQDGKILMCAASEKLIGYIFPGGGRILLGYGLSDNTGSKTGFEGNIYDFNMILSSTIARNHSIQRPSKLKKISHPKAIEQNNFNYFVIGDLDAEHTKEILESENTRLKKSKKERSHIKFTTPNSHIEHDVGLDIETRSPVFRKLPSIFTKNTIFSSLNNESEIFDDPSFKTEQSLPDNSMSRLWKIINKAGMEGKFRKSQHNSQELTKLETQERIVLSEFETPPPIDDPLVFGMMDNDAFHFKPSEIIEPPAGHIMTTQEIKNKREKDMSNISLLISKPHISTSDAFPTLSEIETPPSPKIDDKVYGHWTGNTFAGAVFEYLRKHNFKKKPVPRTIPLRKISDNFPYPSEQNKKNSDFKMFAVHRRYIRSPEINVKIMGESLRNIIAHQHSTEKAVNVEVFNRGEIPKSLVQDKEHLSVSAYNQLLNEKLIDLNHPEPFRINNHRWGPNYDYSFFYQPFDKVDLSHKEDPTDSSQISLQFNKDDNWQRIQSFNNGFVTKNYTNRNYLPNFEDNIFSDNLNLQSFPRLFYQHSPPDSREQELNKNRAIAYEVSKMANSINAAFPYFGMTNYAIPKITSSNRESKTNEKSSTIKEFGNLKSLENPFYKSVKLGNALNENNILGKNLNDRKKSFFGGDDSIPDINRHRSDIDGNVHDERNKAPPSLGPRVCEQIIFTKNRLYVQDDGSIDMTQIHPTLKHMSPGLQLFKEHSDTNCTSTYTVKRNHPLMLIQWIQTPVRIFGGGSPKRKPHVCDLL